jgi:hypothetical protein
MNPARVRRDRLTRLEDLPNIGPAMTRDLNLLGIRTPPDLIGRDAYVLYEELCARTGMRQDPCVLDVFLSVTRFMAGDPAQPWWAFTAERKRNLTGYGPATTPSA